MSERQPGVSGHISGVSGSTYITWYCLIAKKIKNYQTYLKNYQNFAWHNLSCLLHIKKVLKWNPNSSVTLTRNLNGYFSTLRIFSGDTSICKERTWQLVRNLLNFLPQPPRMKSWYHDKVYDFQTLFAFYRILKRFGHMFVVVFDGQDVRNFFSFAG